MSANFAPGARVVIREEEWVVRAAHPTTLAADHHAVQVTGLSELVRGMEATFLTELDDVREMRAEKTALVADPSPGFRRSKLYLESLLRRTPPSGDALSIGHRGAINPADYQLVPAAQALAQPRARILIADGVGLGKTIEVGILLSELVRRGRGQRILVVALKSILAQFQQELWARFTLPLVRLDSTGLERVQARIPAGQNPFHAYDRVIISIDTLKKQARYRRFLEDAHWDVVVVDECQNVALRGGRASQRARLASLLARQSDALILTSATPHDGRPESFASLMNLLEPTAIANPSDYSQDDIKGLYIRRFKKDIAAGGAFKARQITLERGDASTAEQAVFEAIADLRFETLDKRGGAGAMLFRTTLLKAALSSSRACAETCAERIRRAKLKTRAPLEPAAEADLTALSQLIGLCAQVTAERQTKLQRLFALLDEWGYGKRGRGDRVVIFSERIATLSLLQEQLTARYRFKPGEVERFHGTLSDVEQQELVKAFGSKKTPLRILLASDAASEGINLHFYCHRLVHYDIPWSLITLEQRNGRIDRYGQTHTPDLRYLLTLPQGEMKGDLRILERLIEKEDAAHRNLGDAALLLNLHDPVAEEARIAAGIEKHAAPEVVLPDAPLDPNAALLAALMGTATAEAPAAPETVEPLSLYADDLAYTRAALVELGEHDPDLLPPEFLEESPGLCLVAPPDLQRRYAQLPPALRRGHDGAWTLQLTTDRAQVQAALAEARKDPGAWPDWELLWPLHPVAEWIDDRVLTHFGRHEAPVLRVATGLAADEQALLVQGVVSNRRGQPVLVVWVAVRFRPGQTPRLQPLEEFAAETRLAGELVNPGVDLDLAALTARVPAAVEAARKYVKARTGDRTMGLSVRLMSEMRRVKAWQAEARGLIDAERAAIEARRALRSDEKTRFEQRARTVADRMAARERWLNDGLLPVEPAYLRLAAAFLPGSVR